MATNLGSLTQLLLQLEAAGGPPEIAAVERAVAERLRQITVKGCSPEDDLRLVSGELAAGCACYANHVHQSLVAIEAHAPIKVRPRPLTCWPLHITAWRPTSLGRSSEKAAGFILAELARQCRSSQD